MTVPSTVKGGYFDVAVDVTTLGLLDGGGSPITGYVIICGLNTRNLTHQVNTSDEAVPNCQDPEEVPWVSRNANSQEKNMSGTGLHNRGMACQQLHRVRPPWPTHRGRGCRSSSAPRR